MQRSSTLATTSRATDLPVAVGDAWAVVASGAAGPQWYLDALPFVVRGGLDRAVGGAGRRWPAPDRDLLREGDTVGFWRVREADAERLVLVLEADVRAPGRVLLRTEATPSAHGGCRVVQVVEFQPRGLLGRGYQVVDLPARVAVLELTHRRLVADILRSARPG